MSYKIIPPCPELKDFVNHFWTRKWFDGTYYSIASTNVELAFAVKGSMTGRPEFGFSSVKGQTSNFASFPGTGSFELVGVSMFPYAVPVLFDIPVSELENEMVNIDLFFKYEGEKLNDTMVKSYSVNDRIVAISDFLKARLRKARTFDNRIIQTTQRIIRSSGNVNIGDLSTDHCLSSKQFERTFKAYSGFAPRLYSKIVRFQSVLLNAHHDRNLTETAFRCGYFDQSHFIRDFKRFSGFSPKAYFALDQK